MAEPNKEHFLYKAEKQSSKLLEEMENDVLQKKDPSKDCVQQVPSIGWVKNNTEVSKSGFLMLMME